MLFIIKYQKSCFGFPFEVFMTTNIFDSIEYKRDFFITFTALIYEFDQIFPLFFVLLIYFASLFNFFNNINFIYFLKTHAAIRISINGIQLWRGSPTHNNNNNKKNIRIQMFSSLILKIITSVFNNSVIYEYSLFFQ